MHRFPRDHHPELPIPHLQSVCPRFQSPLHHRQGHPLWGWAWTEHMCELEENICEGTLDPASALVCWCVVIFGSSHPAENHFLRHLLCCHQSMELKPSQSGLAMPNRDCVDHHRQLQVPSTDESLLEAQQPLAGICKVPSSQTFTVQWPHLSFIESLSPRRPNDPRPQM